MGKSKRRSLAALVVAAIVLGACSGDDDEGDPSLITEPVQDTSTTSSSTSSSTSTTEDPQAAVEAEVESAYLAYLDAWLAIFSEPNPENPLIDEHTSGPEHQKILDSVTEDVLEGRSTRPPDDPANFSGTVLDVQVQDQRAVVRACVVDGTVVVDNESGEVLDDDLVTLLVEAVMVKDGDWKVSESNVIERTDGRHTCDA